MADDGGWTERSAGGTYLSVGKTSNGRLLEVAFRRIGSKTAFVFHAMDARESQRKRYKKRKRI